MRLFENSLVSNSLSFLYNLNNPDFFISTWSHTGFSYNTKHGDVLTKRNDLDLELYNKIINNYKNVKSIEIENYDEWVVNLPENIKSLMSSRLVGGEAVTSPPQLYKIYKCNELKKQYEIDNDFKYDLVIRIRPDLVFLESLNLDTIDSINHINFGIPGAFYPNRIFDIFFYSNNSNMDKLSETWLNIIDCINDGFDNGLDKRDCCRLLYVSALRNNLIVNDLKTRICDVYRNESHHAFSSKIRWLNGS